MKKRSILIAIVLCLVLLMVSTGVVFAKGKGKPTDFTATMTVQSVGEGTVTSAGESGRWIVKDRPVYGAVSGDILGGFTVVYDANVDLTQAGTIHGTLDFNCPSGGTIHGVIRGKTSPGMPGLLGQSDMPLVLGQIEGQLYYLYYYLDITEPLACYWAWLDGQVTPPTVEAKLYAAAGCLLDAYIVGFQVLPIAFDGSVTLQSGTGTYEGIQGTAKCAGDMASTVIAITATGQIHVVAMIPSSMELTGKWHQK